MYQHRYITVGPYGLLLHIYFTVTSGNFVQNPHENATRFSICFLLEHSQWIKL
jgi:hypothetical protein